MYIKLNLQVCNAYHVQVNFMYKYVLLRINHNMYKNVLYSLKIRVCKLWILWISH